jgi:hypothetical protein
VIVAARNLGAKALRRLGALHKPLLRLARRGARAREQASYRREALVVEREIAAVAASGAPIVAGPWLAEVGYEALYWVPFLRWFQDAYRIAPERITVVSRGGVESWYRGIAAHYVDLFDVLSPEAFAAANARRQASEEGGGRKQSAAGALDRQILSDVTANRGEVAVLHPSLLFRLFRHVWHDSLPFDFFWSHVDYALLERPPRPALAGLPADYIVVKFYTGPAIPDTPAHRAALRAIVRQAAATAPVVALDTGVGFDDHDDYVFGGVPGVVSARRWMTPRTNLGVQTALVAHARCFVGTCGGLAWLAPFLGVPTVGVYADDRQLATHLLTVRHAARRVGAAEFSLLDLRALDRLALLESSLPQNRVDAARCP